MHLNKHGWSLVCAIWPRDDREYVRFSETWELSMGDSASGNGTDQTQFTLPNYVSLTYFAKSVCQQSGQRKWGSKKHLVLVQSMTEQGLQLKLSMGAWMCEDISMIFNIPL